MLDGGLCKTVHVCSSMTDSTHVGLTEARGSLPRLSDRAAKGERIILTLHGREHCAIVSLEDLQRLKEADARRKAKRRSS